MIFSWRALGSILQKVYILVRSSTPACVAYMSHSWYHLLNSCWCMGVLYIAVMACSSDSAGMKCFFNVVLKSAQVPKSTGVAARAVFYLSRAHSPTGVPILK
jgi:hypothetical protein